MRAHIINDGIVVNTIEVDDLEVFPNLINASNGGSIGDSWDGENFTPKVIPPEELASLERRIAILEAQTTEGASMYTVEQLDAYLDTKLDPTTFNALGAVIYRLSNDDMSPAARTALINMFTETKNVFGRLKEILRKVAVEVLKS